MGGVLCGLSPERRRLAVRVSVSTPRAWWPVPPRRGSLMPDTHPGTQWAKVCTKSAVRSSERMRTTEGWSAKRRGRGCDRLKSITEWVNGMFEYLSCRCLLICKYEHSWIWVVDVIRGWFIRTTSPTEKKGNEENISSEFGFLLLIPYVAT